MKQSLAEADHRGVRTFRWNEMDKRAASIDLFHCRLTAETLACRIDLSI